MAIAALILGILGIIANFFTVGIGGAIFGLIALILGILARKKAVAENAPTGVATGGLVTGIISLALGVVFFVACSLCVAAAGQGMKEAQKQMEEQMKNDPNMKKAMDDFNKQLDEAAKKQQ